jgi:hypothetical protein
MSPPPRVATLPSDDLEAPAPPARSRSRRFGLLAAALAGAWLVPLAAYAAGAGWVALVAVVAVTAWLLDSGRSLLDRVIISVALLAGVTCAATLVFSVWPFGLHPVALSGSALTLLAGYAAVRGRAPRRPRLGRPVDALVVASVAGFGVAFARPFLGGDVAAHLALVIRGEDLARHFAMYDTIRRLGGYAFLDPDQAASSIAPINLSYPAGSHLLLAVLDNFVVSATTPGNSLAALDRFLWYNIGCYVFLGFGMLWAARRIAGPAARVPAFLPVAGLLAGFLLVGPLFPMYYYGFLPEIVGLAFLTILVGILARPLASTRQQVLVACALLVAIAFTYYFLLPVAGVAVLVYAWLSRRALWRHRIFVPLVVVPSAPLCLVPRQVNADDHGWDLITTPFGVVAVNLSQVLALALIVAAAVLLTPRWWPRRTTQTLGWTVAAAVGMTLAIGAIQLIKVGKTLYFFDKSMHTVLVLLLVTGGAGAPALARLFDRGRVGSRGRVGVLAALLVAATPLVYLGALDRNPKVVVVGGVYPDPADGSSWGRAYNAGSLAMPIPALNAVTTARNVPDPDGKITLVYTGHHTDFMATLWVAVLERDYGGSNDAFVWVLGPKTPADFEQKIVAGPQRFQVVSTDPALLDRMRQLQAARPELGLDVVPLR